MKQVLFIVVFLMLGLQACEKETNTPIILEYGTVNDIDGNTYKTVKIGEQWWMCENLNVKHFNDGSEIPYIENVDQNSWANAIEPAYSIINDSIYGCFYNHFTVQDAKKLAPVGWHIPSDEEWKILEKTIGISEEQSDLFAWRGTNEAELLLIKKSEGWPNNTLPYGLDSYSFTILPAGCRLHNGELTTGFNAFFWSSTSAANGNGYYRYFDYQKKNIFRQTTYPQYGMSIRCVKD